METKKDFKLSKLGKQLVNSLVTRVVIRSSYKKESLSLGNFYQDFYAIKINDLHACLEQNFKAIKSSKNKKAIALYKESFDCLMEITTLRSEEDILSNLFRSNACIHDAIYLINNGRGK